MKKAGLIRNLFSFYKSFLLLSLVIDTCCVGLFCQYGPSIFSALFWFKLFTLGLSYYFINEYKKKQYYYYYNLGISKTMLWATTLSFDFIIFLFLIIKTYKLR
jgi:hypothetical protein